MALCIANDSMFDPSVITNDRLTAEELLHIFESLPVSLENLHFTKAKFKSFLCDLLEAKKQYPKKYNKIMQEEAIMRILLAAGKTYADWPVFNAKKESDASKEQAAEVVALLRAICNGRPSTPFNEAFYFSSGFNDANALWFWKAVTQKPLYIELNDDEQRNWLIQQIPIAWKDTLQQIDKAVWMTPVMDKMLLETVFRENDTKFMLMALKKDFINYKMIPAGIRYATKHDQRDMIPLFILKKHHQLPVYC